MNGQTEKTEHGFSLNMRKNMSISGVIEVVSFDESYIVMITKCGDMTVEGENIKIDVLDTDKGVIEINGKINGVYYSASEEPKKNGFLGKMFK